MSRQNLKHMSFSQNAEELPGFANNGQTTDAVGHHEADAGCSNSVAVHAVLKEERELYRDR